MTDWVDLIAPRVVTAIDVVRIGRGGTWKDLYVRSTTPGGNLHIDGQPTVTWRSDPRRIIVTAGGDDTTVGLVTWAQIAAYIQRGTTPEVTEQITAAYRSYLDRAGPAEKRFAAHDRLRDLTRDVCRRATAHRNAHTQLGLFTNFALDPPTATPNGSPIPTRSQSWQTA